MNELLPSKIERMIYLIRGMKVMLDSDLAELYGVTTGNLNKAVHRNIARFPSDFMFRLNLDEFDILIFQIGISKLSQGGRRKLPFVFTENGVAMLSGILRSQRAIDVNISIMRIFTRLRSFLMLERELGDRVTTLEKDSSMMFKIVFERLDSLETKTPALDSTRKKIGLR